jgi:hypothetical protein
VCKFTTEAIITEGSDVGTVHKVCAHPACPVHHPKKRAARDDVLVRRDGETFLQLLQRLDLAVALAFTEDIFTDEVNTPSGSSRSKK